MNNFSSDIELLRAEIAAIAARLIAENGTDYGTAKRKAARQVLGNARVRGEILPDNAQIEEEVRIYNQLFFSDTQPARLLHLRKLALWLMNELAQFKPFLTGAVLNGTAGEHSDIYLQLFTDSPKDVEIYLLNRDVSFEVSETAHFNKYGNSVETISFIWKGEGVHLAVYGPGDLRSGTKTSDRSERADINTLRTLIEAEQS